MHQYRVLEQVMSAGLLPDVSKMKCNIITST